MYTALLIMLCGMATGRVLRPWLSLKLLHLLTTCAIFLLLFLLGSSIGSNAELLSRLPEFGLHALVLMAFGVAGSIACCMLIRPLFRKEIKDASRNPEKP